MDAKGLVYPSRAAALNAGVSLKDTQLVKVRTIGNGPFKGRKYLVNTDGSLGRRVKEHTK